MNRRFSGVALGCAIVLLEAGPARAQTPVNCNADPSALVALTNAPYGIGEYQIQGKCVGDVSFSVAGVTFDTSATGATAIQIAGSVFISAPNISLGTSTNGLVIDGSSESAGIAGVTIFGDVTGIVLTGVTILNFPGVGLSAGGPGTVFLEGGKIAGNRDCGLFAYGSMNVELDSGTEITGNGAGTSSALQCGIDVEDNAVLFVSAANVHDNLHGPALRFFQAVGDLTGGTFQAPASVTYPAVALENAKLSLINATITGTGHSDAIFAAPASSIRMQGTTVTEADTNTLDSTILLEDGSTLFSVGGNTISNNGAGGYAIVASNASTFRQRLETALGIPAAADTITGAGSVEVESNFELGTGASTPSTWTGAISAAQNSSLRMDGGMTVNGAVTILQASNGFFNKANGGINVVSGGVSCPSATTAASHVQASATAVVLSPGGATAVQSNCLGF